MCIKYLIPGILILGTVSVQNPAWGQMSPASSLSSSETASSFADQSYVLGAGDQVQITVFDYAEYTGQKVILPDGTIVLPLVGSLNAAGLTAEQLEQALTTRLQTLLVNPVVTVELTALRPVVVTVAGEVRRPGPTELGEFGPQSGTNNNGEGGVPTLSKALIAAGGITQDADIQQVTISRRAANGSSQTMTINLWQAITSDDATSDVVLQEGDSIYVPRLSANAQIDRRLLARSSFAPETIRVRVVGEVKSPGEIQVPPESTLSSAVAIAGGPTEDARLSRVAFIRLNEAGQVESETIDLRNLTDNYQIQEGDVIIVPKRSDVSVIDFAGRLFGPLGAFLNLMNGASSLFQD